jgi:methylated-DNA-[protein]-cysteine S-methyltransferase
LSFFAEKMTMSETCLYHTMDSPVGELLLTANGAALTGAYWATSHDRPNCEAGWRRDEQAFRAVCAQLRAYFAGELTQFDLPLAPRGTEFQQRVWRELCAIPYGATISYRELAARIGKPSAMRAVGAANGRNPISIIVPCHRVIGADNSLTGYGGGLACKRALLNLEAETWQRLQRRE